MEKHNNRMRPFWLTAFIRSGGFMILSFLGVCIGFPIFAGIADIALLHTDMQWFKWVMNFSENEYMLFFVLWSGIFMSLVSAYIYPYQYEDGEAYYC